jgi:hypothetical protein
MRRGPGDAGAPRGPLAPRRGGGPGGRGHAPSMGGSCHPRPASPGTAVLPPHGAASDRAWAQGEAAAARRGAQSGRRTRRGGGPPRPARAAPPGAPPPGRAAAAPPMRRGSLPGRWPRTSPPSKTFLGASRCYLYPRSCATAPLRASHPPEAPARPGESGRRGCDRGVGTLRPSYAASAGGWRGRPRLARQTRARGGPNPALGLPRAALTAPDAICVAAAAVGPAVARRRAARRHS